MKTELIKKIAVTFELCGGVSLSDAAKEMVVADLEAYPPDAVSKALDRCRAEVKWRMAPADIIQRIDDCRPGADEAWALCPKSEAESAVWTDEMAQAFEEVRTMEDRVAARMSFRQAYERLLQAARDARKPVRWWASMGHDQNGRERVIRAAVDAGRLTTARAADLLPGYEHTTVPRLPGKPGPQGIGDIIKQLPGYGDWKHADERATDRDAGEVDPPATEEPSPIIDGEASDFESSGDEQEAAQGAAGEAR